MDPKHTLQTSLSYDPVSGLFTWKVKNRRTKIGDIAGYCRSKAYVYIRVNYVTYSAHNLAYLFMTGDFPNALLDHVDRNKRNNSWNNLRLCTKSENQQNRPLCKNNSSGVKGVVFHKQSGKWQVQLSSNKTSMYLGLYEDKELAELVATEARDKYHGSFACHN